MISFTRTAIAEIRTRLRLVMGSAANSVKIATIDAHAWSIHSGYDEAARLNGSYEQNIERVLTLVNTDDEVSDALSNVEHLVVDEGQDILGLRADLLEAIISKLDRACGVTVFADEAQSIYGFSEEGQSGIQRSSCGLVERLRKNLEAGFESSALETIHRTKSTGLKSIFSDVRATVLAGGAGNHNLYASVKAAIFELSDGCDLKFPELELGELPNDSLVLFRTRPEALWASQFCKRAHSLRLSGYGANLPAWIAICLHGWIQPFMTSDQFAESWQLRKAALLESTTTLHNAWAVLIRIAGTADGALDLSALRRRLSQRSFPAEIGTADFGLPGPVIGTIHASKGREAENVFLLLPPSSEFKSIEDEEEETRVIFVGATRAKSKLRIGSSILFPGASLPSLRSYRRTRTGNGAMVEIGKEGDLEADGLVGSDNFTIDEVQRAQAWLMGNADAPMDFDVVGDAETGWRYHLKVANTAISIGAFGPRLKNDLKAIGKIMGGKGGYLNPANRIKYVRALGCRTIVVSEDDPQLAKLHSPWAQSGFLLSPRLASFTSVQFYKNTNKGKAT
jgi:hypothetical protein